jgi:hypothetical protein
VTDEVEIHHPILLGDPSARRGNAENILQQLLSEPAAARQPVNAWSTALSTPSFCRQFQAGSFVERFLSEED